MERRGYFSIKDWLDERLGQKNPWNAYAISTQLSSRIINAMSDVFKDLPTQIKLKILLSIPHIPKRRMEEWKTELENLLSTGRDDVEPAVTMVAEILQQYPSTEKLVTDLLATRREENKAILAELVADLTRELGNTKHPSLIPVECYYVNKASLSTILPKQEPPVKHFNVKRKTKAELRRSELLEKAVVAASKEKKRSIDQLQLIPSRIKMRPRKVSASIPPRNPRQSVFEYK